MEGLFNRNNSVDMYMIAACYMSQSVVADTALIALTSRLLLLFKISPMLDVNVLADLTATDNRFPLDGLNRLEKPAAEHRDGRDAEDTESEDDDDGEEGSDDEDDSDAGSSADGESDDDDDSDEDDDDSDEDADDSDEDDDEEDEKELQPNHLPRGRSETIFFFNLGPRGARVPRV